MKIAIYGGSFDPVHIGHQLAATLVLATEDVDELWFTPTFKHMGGKTLLDYEHRFAMVRILARQFGGRASVSRAEQRLSRQPGFAGSFTVDLVRAIKEEWPNDEFRFILGSDLVEQSKTWEGWPEVVEKAPPLVVCRAGYTAHLPPDARRIVVPDVSSTDVKAALQRGEDVSKLVPREVLAYIHQHGLYR